MVRRFEMQVFSASQTPSNMFLFEEINESDFKCLLSPYKFELS